MNRRMALAVLVGVAFTAISALMLRLTPLSYLALLPGRLATELLTDPEATPTALAILITNVLVYSVVAFAILRVIPFDSDKAGRVLRILWAPALLVMIFAMVPRFNPIWPSGFEDLRVHERQLQDSLQAGIDLEEARARVSGIEISEIPIHETQEVLRLKDLTITADKGDLLLRTARRTQTAFRYPCSYDLEVVLIFGSDHKMKQRYIRERKTCQ